MALSHNPRIVTDGLVLYLDAANLRSYPGSGTTWFDLTNNNHNATLENGPTHISGSDGYFSFDGTNQKATQTGLPSVEVVNDFYTMELWFKVSTLPSSFINSGNPDSSPLYGRRYGSDYQLFIYPSSNGVSNLGVCYDDSRSSGTHRTNAFISTGEWVQFVQIGLPSGDGTHRGKFKYYINGELDRDETLSDDSNGYFVSSTFHIAYDERFNVYGQLNISSIKRYNRELFPSEIQQNYNALRSRFGL